MTCRISTDNLSERGASASKLFRDELEKSETARNGSKRGGNASIVRHALYNNMTFYTKILNFRVNQDDFAMAFFGIASVVIVLSSSVFGKVCLQRTDSRHLPQPLKKSGTVCTWYPSVLENTVLHPAPYDILVWLVSTRNYM
jgi:hypothetical protein